VINFFLEEEDRPQQIGLRPDPEAGESRLPGKTLRILVGGAGLLLLAIFLLLTIRACSRPAVVVATPTFTPTPITPTARPTTTRLPPRTQTPGVTPTLAERTPEPEQATSLPNLPVGGDPCPEEKIGKVAWERSNQESGALYQEVVGDCCCWIGGQIWTDHRGEVEVWVFAVRPGFSAEIGNFRGGTAWYLDGSLEEIRRNLERQVVELGERSGRAKIQIVLLPDEVRSLVIE